MGERKGLSRWQLIGASAGAGVRAALGLPTARAVAGQGASGGVAVRTTEELVFVNGGIHTMDGNNTWRTRCQSGTVASPPWAAPLLREVQESG